MRYASPEIYSLWKKSHGLREQRQINLLSILLELENILHQALDAFNMLEFRWNSRCKFCICSLCATVIRKGVTKGLVLFMWLFLFGHSLSILFRVFCSIFCNFLFVTQIYTMTETEIFKGHLLLELACKCDNGNWKQWQEER